jgi:DNA/RNA endonuclease YhcR with UshA esterase domain
VGSRFTIAKAGIVDLDYYSKGVKYTLADSTGSIILLVWQNVMEEIPDRYDLVAGSQVQVTGEIDEYRGDLEIIPRVGPSVVVLTRGERLPIEERSVDNVTPSDEGRIFTVEGAAVRTESGDWLKIWLNDGTGEMLIFVPERSVPYLPSGIGGGVRLRITGEVDIYKGVLEIIPLAGADVEVR